jgi:alkyl hydroperoxide reductase subunit AhpC
VRSPLRLGLLLSGVLMSAMAWGHEFHVGGKIAAFKLTDLKGAPVSVSPEPGDVTVVLFISAICPVSNNYIIRMNDLYRDEAPKGVKFFFINANQNEKPAEVEDHARRAGFAFPVYKDVNNVVADRFGAQSTPEAFVIDGAGIVRYHGRIDDSQNPARIQQNSLRLAIDAVLAGREVTAPETKAFGCTIKRVRKVS